MAVALCPTIEELEALPEEHLAGLEAAATRILADPVGCSKAAKSTPVIAFTALVLAKPYLLDRVKVARALKAGL